MAHGLSLLFSVLIVHFGSLVFVTSEPQVPCYFIFGDALVANGNTNDLVTAEKANYPPYGIDFPQGITGRFTNGRTIADIIGQLLGFVNFIPPYVTATDQQISTGINYGSGGAGIREETASHLGDRISLSRQLINHATVASRISVIQRNNTFTQEYLKKCIYISIVGNDDYVNNYLMPNIYPTSRIYTVDQYAAVLIQQYSQQLTRLYNLGARKIAVFSLGQLGCTPTEIARFGTNGKPCVEFINNAIKPYNERLKSLVNELNSNFSDARFTFINLTASTSVGGVALLTSPCCQIREDGQCVPNSIPCLVRDLSLYYDGLHPTEIANVVIAGRSYKALTPMDASPYDISQLARL